MNPCPCGYLGDQRGGCRCSLDRVLNYRARISGPLLDRIDLQVLVQRLPAECLRPGSRAAESSAEVRTRVCAARERQLRRGGDCNARLKGDLVEEVCGLPEECWELLEEATERFSLSARAHQRVRRVARTIADLAGRDDIAVADVAEALGLRQFDREPVQSQALG
jgi:magnesium chelatase family protein